jgi:hypothetical protein
VALPDFFVDVFGFAVVFGFVVSVSLELGVVSVVEADVPVKRSRTRSARLSSVICVRLNVNSEL